MNIIQSDNNSSITTSIAARFRKFLPIVIDVETGGFNCATDALLELAAVPILMDDTGKLYYGETISVHFEPFDGAHILPSSLAFTGIQLDNPFRKAISENEKDGLKRLFNALKPIRKTAGCHKCILVGHNAHFDLGFLNAAIERTGLQKYSPFHPFSVLDTASFAALAFGQTVLARAVAYAGIDFDGQSAHSAEYDARKTAELFCYICNNLPVLAPQCTPTQTNGEEDEKQQ